MGYLSTIFRRSALALALIVAACGGNKQPPPPPPPTVTVATPIAREVVDWDDYTGRFVAPQDVEVRARVTGTVTRIYFRDGQDVGKGALLFEIDPRPYRAALLQSQAQVARARAAQINANQVTQRSRILASAQAVSREELEGNIATQQTATADVAAAQANLATARLNLDFAQVRAPFAGRVSDRRVSLGDAVTADTTVLTRVVSLDPIWFAFEGAEAFYLKNLRQDRRGERGSSRNTANPIEIQLSDESSYRWHGRMEFLDNAIDPGSGTIRAHAVVLNHDRFLTPGMFGRARLIGSGTYRAMLIPDEAIVTDQTRRLVYVLNREGKVIQRLVETGALVEGLRIVRAGLAPTDLVVLEGLGRLQPNMKVTAKRTRIQVRPGQQPTQSATMAEPESAQATPR